MRFRAAALVLGLMVAASSGCAGLSLSGAGTSLRLISERGEAALVPEVRTSVYRRIDQNTADIFVSDLDAGELALRLRSPSGPPATLLRIHMFITPKAGQTPIDFTASNATLTCVVFAGATRGVYGGGAFLLPTGAPGDERWGGRIREGSLRLTDARDGFVDRLGSATLEGTFRAERDDELAARLNALLVATLNE